MLYLNPLIPTLKSISLLIFVAYSRPRPRVPALTPSACFEKADSALSKDTVARLKAIIIFFVICSPYILKSILLNHYNY